METTFCMLQNKFRDVQSRVLEKLQNLKMMTLDREKQKAAFKRISGRLREHDLWLSQAKSQYSEEEAVDMESAIHSQQQLAELKNLKTELDSRLCELSDLKVQCGQLMTLDSSGPREMQLNQHVVDLHSALADFRSHVSAKQDQMKDQITMSEKNQREAEDVMQNAEDLRKWFEDSRKTTFTPIGSEVSSSASFSELNFQESLGSQISELRSVVESLAALSVDRRDDHVSSWPDKGYASGSLLSYHHPRMTEMVQADSTSELSCMRNCFDELRACWDTLENQLDRKDVQMKQVVENHHQFSCAMDNVHRWLDDIELQLFSSTFEQDAEQALAGNEALKKELKKFGEDLEQMNSKSLMLSLDVNSEHKVLLQQMVERLNQRLIRLEEQATKREAELKTRINDWAAYQRDMSKLMDNLVELHQEYIHLRSSDPSFERLSEDGQRLGQMLEGYEAEWNELKARRGQMLAGCPQMVPWSVEVDLKVQKLLLDVKQLASEQTFLIERTAVHANQYECMLKEFAEFLETAKTKLMLDALSCSSSDDLHQQLILHQNFFRDLVSHHSMLNSLRDRTDVTTRLRCRDCHMQLDDASRVILDKANLRYGQLQQTTKLWSDFHKHFENSQMRLKKLRRTLQENSSLALGNSDELQQRIRHLKEVNDALKEDRYRMCHMVDAGKQLLQFVNCPSLKKEFDEFNEDCVDIHSNASRELQRLETMVDLLDQFERDAGELEIWLSHATEEVLDLTNYMQQDDIATVKSQKQQMLLIRKEMENQHPVKSRLQLNASKLVHLHHPNERHLQLRIDSIEKKWLCLVGLMPTNEQQLHVAEMALLPSRQALKEVMDWIDKMEFTLREISATAPKCLEDVQLMLTRYRDLKVEVSHWQLTVEFVNRVTPAAADDKSVIHLSDQVEFSDQIGLMNRRFLTVATDAAEKLKRTELLFLNWNEYEQNVRDLLNWFNEQQQRLKSFERISHRASIPQALADIQLIVEALEQKKLAISHTEQLGTSLIRPSSGFSVVDVGIHKDIDGLNHKWTALDKHANQLRCDLENLLKQYEQFNLLVQAVLPLMDHVESTLEKFRTTPVENEDLKSKFEEIKQLKTKFLSSQPDLEKLKTNGKDLFWKQSTDVRHDIDEHICDITNRWEKLAESLSARMSQLEEICKLMKAYNAEYDSTFRLISEAEILVHSNLRAQPGDAVHIQPFEIPLDSIQNILVKAAQAFSSLQKLCHSLTEKVDNASISLRLRSQEVDLEQRLTSLKHSLANLKSRILMNNSSETQFLTLMADIDKFLEGTEQTLHSLDLNPGLSSGVEEMQKGCATRLKELLLRFKEMHPSFESINCLARSLSLTEQHSRHVQELNCRWRDLLNNTKEKMRQLQQWTLLKQDFKEKCDDWLIVLAQVEKDLNVPLSGSYEGLLQQRDTFEAFQNDLYSRQQTLHSIISEGHQIIVGNEATNIHDLERKLDLLADKWQGILDRTNRKRADIYRNLSLWEKYRNNLETTRQSLLEIEHNMEPDVSTKNTIDRIGTALAIHQKLMAALSGARPQYLAVQEVGASLMKISDAETQQKIHTDLGELETKWLTLDGKLLETTKSMKERLKLWNEMELGMELMLTKLKDARLSLQHPLPVTYDDLEAEVRECKQREQSMEGLKERFRLLSEKLHQLELCISEDDTSILRQRLQLLNKLSEELLQQVVARQQHISNLLKRWNQFSERCKHLEGELKRLEAELTTNSQLSVEDLILALNTRYRDELLSMRKTLDDLNSLSQVLLLASNGARAKEVKGSVKRLEDLWLRVDEKAVNRLKKLEDTLRTVQQLERNMKILRQWLIKTEHELNLPLVYNHCDFEEIKEHISQQQDQQKDIEKKSAGVTAVIGLCEVLYRDSDACPTSAEAKAIVEAKTNLELRWKNILQLSFERKQGIEVTWNLWERFGKLTKTFMTWLDDTELILSIADVTDNDLENIKEDRRKCQKLKQDIDCHLSSLENINRLYRQLAREGRNDRADELKRKVELCNNRWDVLSQNVNAILHRIESQLNVSQKFSNSVKNLTDFLNRIDVEMTQIDCLSSDDNETKLIKIKAIGDEIEKKRRHLYLMDEALHRVTKRTDPVTSAQIQEDFHLFRDEVLSRQISLLDKLQKLVDKEKSRNVYENEACAVSLHAESARHLPEKGPKGSEKQSAMKKDAPVAEADLSAALELAITEASTRLVASEAAIGSDVVDKDNSSADLGLDRVIVSCKKSMETVHLIARHLSAKTQIPVTVLQQIQAMDKKLTELDAAYARIKGQGHSPDGLVCDLDDLEEWLSEAEAILAIRADLLLSPLSQLEVAIRRHKEFLSQMDFYQPRIASTFQKAVSMSAVQRNSHTLYLVKRARSIHLRYEAICAEESSWRKKLQMALGYSPDFRIAVSETSAWLDRLEQKLNKELPVDILDRKQALLSKYNKFKNLKTELNAGHQRVSRFQDMALFLMKDDTTADAVSIKKKLQEVGSKLKKLTRTCQDNINLIESNTGWQSEHSALGQKDVKGLHFRQTPPSEAKSSTEPSLRYAGGYSTSRKLRTRRQPVDLYSLPPEMETNLEDKDIEAVGDLPKKSNLLVRVCWAAVPVQLLLFLLLGAMLLVTFTCLDDPCANANNLKNSFQPMLNYRNGVPPT